MVVLINGSFGVGKTVVARELHARTPGSAIFDPETIGIVLQRPLQWLRPNAPGARDFQNLRTWRRLTVRRARTLQRRHSPLFAPMAFSDREILAEVRSGLTQRGVTVTHFCLTAPLATVEARLRGRGERPDTPGGDWASRRARECVAAHAGPGFDVRVPTQDRTVADVAADILAQLAGGGGA